MALSSCSKMQRPSKESPAVTGPRSDSPPSMSFCSCIPASPPIEQDAVFFGPDTYRFVRLLRTSLTGLAADKTIRLIDVGSGSGAGGIFAARLLGKGVKLVLADINRKALAFSARQRRSQ